MKRLIRSLVLALAVIAGTAPPAAAGWMAYEPVWWGGQWWTRMYWVEPLVAPTYVGVMPGYWAPYAGY